MGVHPKRRFDCASTITRTGSRSLAGAAGNGIDETASEQGPDFIEPDVATALGGGLRQFGDHHQFGQWRYDADLPCFGVAANGIHEIRFEKERQALVATDVIVGADIFRIGMADQNRSRHQFEKAPLALISEAALAYIR